MWDHGTQRGPRIADEVELVRIAHADHVRIGIDLHGAGLVVLGHELRVRKARPDREHRVAVLHELVAGPGAQQADRPGHERQVVGQDVLAEQRLGNTSPEQVGDLDQLRRRVPSALPDEYGDLAAGVQDVRRPPHLDLGRDSGRLVETDGGRDHLELVGRR
jgi:hypothetical protein